MNAVIYLSFLLARCPESLASIPKNGVVITANSLASILDETNENSAYSLCVLQSRGARFFSNNCTHLIESLRKKMNTLALESDLQMQAERLQKKPLSSDSVTRIAMLAKLNLLATQAEDAIKATQLSSKKGDSRDDLPDILPAVKKVQISYQSYLRYFPKTASRN